ncbi:MAG: hypothetical protein Kow00108_04440 [Calditrichia bacterium]
MAQTMEELNKLAEKNVKNMRVFTEKYLSTKYKIIRKTTINKNIPVNGVLCILLDLK